MAAAAEEGAVGGAEEAGESRVGGPVGVGVVDDPEGGDEGPGGEAWVEAAGQAEAEEGGGALGDKAAGGLSGTGGGAAAGFDHGGEVAG